jgi:chromosome segregation ATPase
LSTLQAQLVVSRRTQAEVVEPLTAVQNQLLATQVTYQDMLAKFTLAQQTVGDMRARCALAEGQADELRQGQTTLRMRSFQTEQTCKELRDQLLLLEDQRPRDGRLAAAFGALSSWCQERFRREPV